MSNRDEFTLAHNALEREVADRWLNIWMPGASHAGIISPVAATQTVVVSGSSNAQANALVVNGISCAYISGATDALTATAIAAAVNGSGAGQFVTATVATATVTLTALLTPTQNGAQGNNVTVTGTGTQTGITITGATLSGGLTGLLPWPDNKGILAVYQLNAGYYMVVLQDNFRSLLSQDINFIIPNGSTHAAAPLVQNVVDAVGARTSGHILLASMVNADTVTINGTVFTCTTAAQASNVTFQVGANDGATAQNLASTINGVNVVTGASTGFGQIDSSLSATAILLASSGGAVLVSSTKGGPTGSVASAISWSISAHGTLTPSTALANGPSIILCFLAAAGTTPTDPAVNEIVKADFKLRVS